MRIGIVGLGSIGKRHVRCLKQLGYDDVVALRTKKGATKTLPAEFDYIKEVFNAGDFYSSDLEAVIISNPTGLHIETMKTPLKKGIPVFLEKPVADSIEQVEQVENLDTSKVMVAFMLRHNELINAVKRFIDAGRLGRVYKAHLYCGHYLPFWHRYADYKNEYYSRTELGGGVLRTLSHEIDLMHYFFGTCDEVWAVVGKISDLDIEVDDNALVVCRTSDDSLITIETDYINPLLDRRGQIMGSEGKIEYTFQDNEAVFTSYKEKSEVLYKNSRLLWNQMYLKQMETFINFLTNDGVINCDFQDGINVMKVIEAAEESTRTGTWQRIKQESHHV
jgi:predicted dehydrogenase